MITACSNCVRSFTSFASLSLAPADTGRLERHRAVVLNTHAPTATHDVSGCLIILILPSSSFSHHNVLYLGLYHLDLLVLLS